MTSQYPRDYDPTSPSGPIETPAQQPPPPPKKKRSLGKVIALVLTGVVLLAVIAAVGLELYLRNKVTSCIEQGVSQDTKASAEASLSKRPILLQWASGALASLEVKLSGVNGSPGLDATAYLTDVKFKDSTTIGNAVVVGHMSAEGIKSQVVATGMVGNNPEVTLDKTAGTFTVKFSQVSILPIPGELVFKPELRDGKLVVTATKADVAGFGVPTDLVSNLVSATEATPTPKGLTATNISVDDTGVSMRFEGSNLSPEELGTNATTSSDLSAKCSVL